MGERKRVILAEDTAIMREQLTTVLTSLGYEVQAFEDGALALEGLRRLTPKEQNETLLITDCVMPKMGGLQLAKMVSAAHPHIPIMIWTLKFEPDDREVMHLNGGHYGLGKTFNPKEIQEAIDTTLRNFDPARTATKPVASKHDSMVDRIKRQSPHWNRQF